MKNLTLTAEEILEWAKTNKCVVQIIRARKGIYKICGIKKLHPYWLKIPAGWQKLISSHEINEILPEVWLFIIHTSWHDQEPDIICLNQFIEKIRTKKAA
ncbi:hypothetical protein A2Y83_04945 [Candidatus Falkowbacteria bacterium RBG_13_39_14]|uniref:Uncharacterized protein n=1 Tax=Candidatus Falkowbacteria bacterium RBG_13_39_14 TaxID=1797985 RepID=A0A1F5S226_9BACT|nr:MAG: hypothetical protein A2Y83_04945 [Candidatus Falkowbacteria bacterium RBG_13_39_14]